MISFFNKILEKRDLRNHDGRPLWKYDLTNNEYIELKNHLSIIKFNNLDYRDITFFFAEWWRREYNGGSPRKMDVFKCVNPENIDEDSFYIFAKRGAEKLGINWIQRENKLYFRTLLLQGGLPEKHLFNPNNYNAYFNFFKKIIDLNPSTIDEFEDDYEIISKLPYSSRNGAIYESCLKIVHAIYDEDDYYLSRFEFKGGTNYSRELKKYKASITRKIGKNSKLRINWILKANNGNYQISLKFYLGTSIGKESLCEILNIKEERLKQEYKLVVNDEPIYRFRKTMGDSYKLIRFSNSIYKWDGTEMKPDIYLSSEGKRFEIPFRFIDYPKLSTPTLWTEKSENNWILQRGRQCPEDRAFILYPSEWLVHNQDSEITINLFNHEMNWCEFTNEIVLYNNSKEKKFVTKKTSFDWYLQENRPEWIINSNLKITRGKPRIVVYNENKPVDENEVEFYWKVQGNDLWKEWKENMPNCSCIEYRIVAFGCVEEDFFYNIGQLNLDIESISIQKATITVERNYGLEFDVIENNNLAVKKDGNTILLTLKDLEKISPVKAIISNEIQKRKLHFVIGSPFQGVNILDSNNNVLADLSKLVLGNLNGYRIISPMNQNNHFIKIFNSTNKNMFKKIKLQQGRTSLIVHDNDIKNMFLLSDNLLNEDSAVTIELLDESDIQSTYNIKNYNQSITKYDKEMNELYLSNVDKSGDQLLALPLDTDVDEMEPLKLIKNEDYYAFPENISDNKFIVVKEQDELDDPNLILLPKFVMTKDEINPIYQQDRINGFRTELRSQTFNESSWQKVKKYAKYCNDYKIPFSTFDYLKSVSSKPDLLAKIFCFFKVYDQNFEPEKVESDVGFCFHWIEQKYWENAIEWVGKSLQTIESLDEREKILKLLLFEIIEEAKNTNPSEWFNKITKFLFNKKTSESYTSLNPIIHELRGNLGKNVLNELPKEIPKIPDEYRNIIQVKRIHNRGIDYPREIWSLLLSPLAVALSISGKDEGIWADDEKMRIVRRNIQYIQQLAPEWYGRAILYSLNRLESK